MLTAAAAGCSCATASPQTSPRASPHHQTSQHPDRCPIVHSNCTGNCPQAGAPSPTDQPNMSLQAGQKQASLDVGWNAYRGIGEGNTRGRHQGSIQVWTQVWTHPQQHIHMLHLCSRLLAVTAYKHETRVTQSWQSQQQLHSSCFTPCMTPCSAHTPHVWRENHTCSTVLTYSAPLAMCGPDRPAGTANKSQASKATG
jgi:hypothetical protein